MAKDKFVVRYWQSGAEADGIEEITFNTSEEREAFKNGAYTVAEWYGADDFKAENAEDLDNTAK